MNLYELDALIQSCKDNGDDDLVAFYQKKRKVLLNQIGVNVAKALAKSNS